MQLQAKNQKNNIEVSKKGDEKSSSPSAIIRKSQELSGEWLTKGLPENIREALEKSSSEQNKKGKK